MTREHPSGAWPAAAHAALPPIDNRFLFVNVAAMRAKQLRRGARPRVSEDDPLLHETRKPERIAMEEVRRGLVEYSGGWVGLDRAA